jgi:hypothetical protein
VTFESNSKLTRIGSDTFAECSSLKSIQIPASVEAICACCFDYCESLISVTFESNSHLTLIESEAFRGCISLRSVCIPASVQILSSSCFYLCDSLHTLTFAPNSALRNVPTLSYSDYWPIESMCIPAAFPINAKLWSALCRLLSRCFVQISESSLKLFRQFSDIWLIVLELSDALIRLIKPYVLCSLIIIFMLLTETSENPISFFRR